MRIPADCRFSTDKVFVRRDPQTGDLVLSEAPGDWEDIFAACDKAAFPESFLVERDQDLPQVPDL